MNVLPWLLVVDAFITAQMYWANHQIVQQMVDLMKNCGDLVLVHQFQDLTCETLVASVSQSERNYLSIGTSTPSRLDRDLLVMIPSSYGTSASALHLVTNDAAAVSIPRNRTR